MPLASRTSQLETAALVNPNTGSPSSGWQSNYKDHGFAAINSASTTSDVTINVAPTIPDDELAIPLIPHSLPSVFLVDNTYICI
jgi:hypothetical protein